jgi:predicted transcriptional regulator
MKYRSKTDILASILEAANGGDATKSQILYKSFLSYCQLREHIQLLFESGLLELEPDQSQKTRFKTTEKGLRFLKIHKELNQIFTEKEEDFKIIRNRTDSGARRRRRFDNLLTCFTAMGTTIMTTLLPIPAQDFIPIVG